MVRHPAIAYHRMAFDTGTEQELTFSTFAPISGVAAAMPMLMLGILFGAIIVAGAVFGFELHPPAPGEIQMSYADLAAVMLGAVAVLVTVLGVFIAILALWGYAQFKSNARSAAIDHVEEELKDGGKLRLLLRDRVDEILLSDADVRSRSAERREAGDIADEEYKD